MLKLFHNARTARLVRALQSADLDTLTALGRRLQPDQLQQPLHEGLTAIELSIQAEQPAALQWVLEQYPQAQERAAVATAALIRALHQPQQSLALLSVLLKAGADANHRHENRPLVHWCFDCCSPSSLMLHLGRLVEAGARLDDPALLPRALHQGDRALIHYLINAGAPLVEPLEGAGQDPEVLAYARRCADDKRIREMLLG